MSQKCLCQASESDPMLLTQKAIVGDQHIWVSRPGLLEMTLSPWRGNKQVEMRKAIPGCASVVPYLVVGTMHIICSLPYFILSVSGDMLCDDSFCVYKRFIALISVCFSDFLSHWCPDSYFLCSLIS